MRAMLVLGSAALALAGCATPYQQMGPTGGVRATRITDDIAQVTASGNAYTDPDTVQRYALRRAAEETVADGFDLFRISADLDRSATGTASYGVASGNRYSVFGSGFTMPIVKPGQTLMIKMMKGPKPDPMPDGEFDAREVLSHLVGTPYGGDRKSCRPGPDGKIVCT
jgi:hypothetical protein